MPNFDIHPGILIILNENNTVFLIASSRRLYFIRMAMKLSCTMYLNKFPLDFQICYIKISTCKLCYGFISFICSQRLFQRK